MNLKRLKRQSRLIRAANNPEKRTECPYLYFDGEFNQGYVCGGTKDKIECPYNDNFEEGMNYESCEIYRGIIEVGG